LAKSIAQSMKIFRSEMKTGDKSMTSAEDDKPTEK
jgi:Sec-independent protein translocase protein TatA